MKIIRLKQRIMKLSGDEVFNGALLTKPYERPGSYIFFKAIRKN